MSDEILLRIEDGVGTITLNRPERLNALDADTIAQLYRCALRAGTAADVRVVLVSGAGRGGPAVLWLLVSSTNIFLVASSSSSLASEPLPGVKTRAPARSWSGSTRS